LVLRASERWLDATLVVPASGNDDAPRLARQSNPSDMGELFHMVALDRPSNASEASEGRHRQAAAVVEAAAMGAAMEGTALLVAVRVMPTSA